MSAENSALMESLSDDGSDDDTSEDHEKPLPFCIRYGFCLKLLCVPAILIGAAIFLKFSEDWAFLTSFYVMVQIVTTIGYGDVTVNNPISMIFMTFLVLVTIFFIASCVNDVGNWVSNKEADLLRRGLADVAVGKAPKAGHSRYHLMSLCVAFVMFLGAVAFGTIFYATYESCSCGYGQTQKDDYPTCVTVVNGTDYNGKVHAKPNCGAEGQTKTWLKAFYMTIITITTVGYGDYYPMTELGRFLAIFWMLLGVLATGNLVGAVATTIGSYVKHMKKRHKNSKKKLKAIAAQDASTDQNSLSRADFLEYMLFKGDLVDQETIDHINQVFESMHPVNRRVPIDVVADTLANDEED